MQTFVSSNNFGHLTPPVVQRTKPDTGKNSNPMTIHLSAQPKFMPMYSYLFRVLLILLTIGSSQGLSAQCNPDVTPPVAICDEFTVVSLSANGTATIFANTFDDGSYDLCCLDTLLVQRQVDGPCDGDNLPDDFAASVTFCCEDVNNGPVNVVLRVLDCAGHFTDCITEVTVSDKLKPICQAPANLTMAYEDYLALNLDLNDTIQMNAAFGAPTASDNCGIQKLTHTLSVVNDNCSDPSRITRSFIATDPYGNAVIAQQQIFIIAEYSYSLHIPGDFYFNDPVLDSLKYLPDSAIIGIAYSDVVYTADCFGAQSRTNRTWSAINWCGPNQGAPPFVLPKLDMDGDGRPGDAYDISVKADSVYLLVNGQPTIALGASASLFEYLQLIRSSPSDTLEAGIGGKIFLDASGNCAYDSGESPFRNTKVVATGLVTGEVFETTPDITGAYYLPVCTEDTLVEITLDLSWNYGQNCPTTYIVATNSNQTTIQDIPVGLTSACPLLIVDLSTPFLRRCFFNSYSVQVCNLSTETIPDVYVEVKLDEYFQFSGGSIPGASIGNNSYSFDLGDMAAGACSQFQVFFNLSCDAPLGFTHCSNAFVYPDTFCYTPPSWSGANIEVQALCDGDSVRLSIVNTGLGDMALPLDFVVVEDVIMFQSGNFQLNTGFDQPIAVPANGATWRIEAQQEPDHPWGGVAAVALEGCGGLNTTGLVNIFPLNNPSPFQSRDCQENRGAYDPNDKQAFPRGYGSEHLVEANTDLDYLIRFQNTGTDTAFRVVVLDTLSKQLDIASVRPGVASHPYEFSILEGNVLRFRFDNILLPDSNVNEAASHGFLKFQVAQKPDLANGIRIENRAAIYFDFNDPVLTNTTFHTIGDHFILVSTKPGPAAFGQLSVYPNPGTDYITFELEKAAPRAQFELHNSFGQQFRQESFIGDRYRFERKNLPAGIYFYQIQVDNIQAYTGKILLK